MYESGSNTTNSINYQRIYKNSLKRKLTLFVLRILPRHKIFFISLIATFFWVVLPILGVRPQEMIVSPIPVKQDFFDSIVGKLDVKGHNYRIQKESSLIPSLVAASDYDLASAYAAVDYESGQVIVEKNLSQKIPIASLTKIMTAVVALDLAQPDEYFNVSYKAANMIPTKLALSEGDQLSLEELLNGLMLTSANDCAQVIKEGIDTKYGEKVFIKAMNKKAEILGLKNSRFQNPQGFDSKDNYSSVEDLAILTHYALENYPLIAQIVAKEFDELNPTPTHKRYEYLNNWNGLIGVYPGTIGVKIGNTDQAGKTTVVVSEREGKKVLAVVLGAPGIIERDLWASQLLDRGFEQNGLESINISEQDLRDKYARWKYEN